jgi:hypothetical protein
MLRIAGAVLGGCVAWAVAATLINLALRLAWPAYAAVEKSLEFTLLMLIARLILGALASFAAGIATSLIGRRKPIATWILIILLLAIFMPVHIGLWAKFPAWYHLIFFASLVVFPLVGNLRRTSR